MPTVLCAVITWTVAGAQLSHQRGNVLGQLMAVSRIVCAQNFADAGDFRCRFGRAAAAFASHQHVDVAANLLRGCNTTRVTGFSSALS